MKVQDICNIFDNGGFNVFKVAHPSHKKTPNALQNLGNVNFEKDKDKVYSLAINEFKNMSDESYEYSRLSIYCFLENIIEDLQELKFKFGSIVNFKSSNDVFVSLFSDIQEYFKATEPKTQKKITQKFIKAQIEATITYVEGVLFLKKMSEQDINLIPLISQYEKHQTTLLTRLEKYQKTVNENNPKFKIVTVDEIMERAQSAMDVSLTFNYNSINHDHFERIMIDVGDKNQYWYAIQSEEKWNALYAENPRQSLSKESLEKLRGQLPLILEQYKNLHYLSFTNMFKVLVLSTHWYASYIGSRNEREPKNDDEYNQFNKERDAKLERDEIKFGSKPMPRKVQTPETTHENLKFSSELLSTTLTLTTLLDTVSGFNEPNENCLTLERFDDEYDVLKMTNHDLALILFKDHSYIHSSLVRLTDLEKNDFTPYIDANGDTKTTSFNGMTHFLREIKDQFVQEYFFGKQDTILNFIDKRI